MINANMSDYSLALKLTASTNSPVSVDDRINKKSTSDEMSPAMKMYYQDYMQKILMSDGSDPDNQPDW